jgi:hypothetical protein
VRASDLLIGSAALLPVALKIGLGMKKGAQKRSEKNRAA